MPTISPVSELRNYNVVLEKVKPDSPVYLTKNGHGAYSIHSIQDDEEYRRMKAMATLMVELVKGFQSGEEEGWFSEEEVDKYFADKKRRFLAEEMA